MSSRESWISSKAHEIIKMVLNGQERKNAFLRAGSAQFSVPERENVEFAIQKILQRVLKKHVRSMVQEQQEWTVKSPRECSVELDRFERASALYTSFFSSRRQEHLCEAMKSGWWMGDDSVDFFQKMFQNHIDSWRENPTTQFAQDIIDCAGSLSSIAQLVGNEKLLALALTQRVTFAELLDPETRKIPTDWKDITTKSQRRFFHDNRTFHISDESFIGPDSQPTTWNALYIAAMEHIVPENMRRHNGAHVPTRYSSKNPPVMR